MNSIGTEFRITLIGSSHGSIVGVVIDGVPPGKEIDKNSIQIELNKRRPGQSSVTTDRVEKDTIIIEAGIYNGRTTGEPIVAYVRNKDIDSSYYEEIKDTPRPGHADYPAHVKYKGFNDVRGGGRFSGRLTLGIVIAGSIAQQILQKNGITFIAYSRSIGQITTDPESLDLTPKLIYAEQNLVRTADPEAIQPMIKEITNAKEAGDSVGGIVECIIQNLPIGIGEPWFDSVESRLAHIIFSIPAVKGIEFGSGFASTTMTGSKHNDEYEYHDDKVVTKTNNAGGILGGLTNGMPVVFRVAFKPTSSIKKTQQTVNLGSGELDTLKIKGRHDPCIVPRAVPVVENAAACVLLDLMLQDNLID
ncbi:MAG: chorismate synthase [Candidatus Heimdallarchaeota archaeon]|nr:chorismate synthase [Candidatus Heimdallarchaeota archaeon]